MFSEHYVWNFFCNFFWFSKRGISHDWQPINNFWSQVSGIIGVKNLNCFPGFLVVFGKDWRQLFKSKSLNENYPALPGFKLASRATCLIKKWTTSITFFSVTFHFVSKLVLRRCLGKKLSKNEFLLYILQCLKILVFLILAQKMSNQSLLLDGKVLTGFWLSNSVCNVICSIFMTTGVAFWGEVANFNPHENPEKIAKITTPATLSSRKKRVLSSVFRLVFGYKGC